MTLTEQQREICRRHGAEFLYAPLSLKLGLARDLQPSEFPLHGLCHPPESGTCGWFIWTGELDTTDAEFFAPVHIGHLPEGLAFVLPYLGLAPGWRFLLAPGYEDVWFDSTLLHI